MALWPFQRRSVRKRFRSGVALPDKEPPPLRAQADAGLARTKSKQTGTEPTKLRRRQRAYSFSPGRNDSIRTEQTRGITVGHNRESHHDSSYGNAADSCPAPTLHPTRRKSSKRRREDHDREAEIKAMSVFIPSRSAAGSCGRSSSKQSTKRAKTGGLDHQYQQPSQISLSYPDSLRSVLSADSDFVAYKLSALDSLAPRPTLKYTPSTRRTPSRAAMAGALEHMQRPLGEREPIEEDPLDASRRIDHLADDLNAKDLRELMERDNRRRERKRIQEQERLEKKLACRAERTRREQAEARTSGTPPPENLERGVMGREMVGLGIEPASTIVTSSKKRESALLHGTSADPDDTRPTQPLEVFHRPETSPKNDHHEPTETKQTSLLRASRAEVGETVSALPEAHSRLAGFLHSKKSRSKSTLGSDKDHTMDEESGRKNSESSNKTSNRLSLTSLLKWGSKNKRYSGPSSFSNTSREEMQVGTSSQNSAQAEALARLQGDDAPNQASLLSSKAVSAVPKRTKSRFREDLPDFPLSPPDSRVQSPEADPPPAAVAVKSSHVVSRLTPPLGSESSLFSEHPKPSANHETHLSMSLASIDSEGSWLSGRVGSSRVPRKQNSLARISRRDNAHPSDSPTNSTRDDFAIADDEYLSHLVADRNSAAMTGSHVSGEGRRSSDGDESMANESLKWGHVGAKPEVVQNHYHDRDTMRSSRGLLNIDSGDEEDAHMLTPLCSV